MITGISVLGLALVDTLVSTIREIPEPRKKTAVFVDSIVARPGGGAANTAQNLALLGVDVDIFTRVGNDSLGEFLRDTLAKRGVNVDSLTKDPVQPTSHTVVQVHEGGERTFLCCTPLSGTFDLKDIDLEKLAKNKFLLYQDFFSFPKLDAESAVELLRYVKAHGVTVFLDECQGYLGLQRDLWEKIAPFVDYLLPSFDDLLLMYPGASPEELCERFHQLGATHVVIKRGPESTLFSDGNGIRYLAPMRTAVVDATGAGDSFDAGFVYGIINGASFSSAVEMGHLVASECIGHVGAMIPEERGESLRDLLEGLRQQEKG